MITILLDSVWKDRNNQEGRYVSRASITYEGTYYESVGDYDNIQALLRSVPWQKAHFDALLDVKRGDTSVFVLCPLKGWIFPEKKPMPKNLQKWREKQ